MSFQRRKLLRILSFAFGADSISTGSEFGMMAQTAAQSAIPASAGAALEVACAVNSRTLFVDSFRVAGITGQS